MAARVSSMCRQGNNISTALLVFKKGKWCLHTCFVLRKGQQIFGSLDGWHNKRFLILMQTI